MIGILQITIIINMIMRIKKNENKNTKDIDEEKKCNIYDNILKQLNIQKK